MGGKVAVVGMKDQDTGQVHAEVTSSSGKETLQGFVHDNTVPGATVYTDVHKAYSDMQGMKHKTVKHSVGEYVNDQATTNAWSLLGIDETRYHGMYHHWSEKHMDRYVDEFEAVTMPGRWTPSIR